VTTEKSKIGWSGTCLLTIIMFGANMNLNSLKRTLDKLIAQGLVEEQPIEGNKISNRIYILTERGANVLNYLKTVNEILDPETIDISI
jgi:predicted transcriptional regulator